ncbi:MAG: glycosyltransferase [Bacteroidales bacterium]|nr:glycosyltransferase [Bacteroidales bacterium]MBN2698807.1 glycosyltransferase [Bacteroidales bacterium]
MIWLAFPAMVLLAVRLTIVLVNLLTRPWLTRKPLKDTPPVSVLIPARNEEKNLSVLLSGLLEQDYRDMEIIVYNDESTDRTLEIIKAFSKNDSRIQWIDGGPVPEGWNGKNYACDQLAGRASGKYFLFLDGDVRVESGLIEKSLAHSEQYDLSLLSIFPRQLMITTGEQITVPVMNWILLSLLPLSLIRLSHRSSLAAANGQFMLFRAREYRHHRFHRMVREMNVEDIQIMRKMKRMGYRGHTVLSRGEVTCRMYHNFSEAIRGFTRSMFAFFGGSALLLIFFTVFTTFGFIFVWIGLSWKVALLYLGAGLLLRIIAAGMSYQPLLRVAFLAPIQQISFLVMVLESFRLRSRGRNTWKGRTIKYKGQ